MASKSALKVTIATACAIGVVASGAWFALGGTQGEDGLNEWTVALPSHNEARALSFAVRGYVLAGDPSVGGGCVWLEAENAQSAEEGVGGAVNAQWPAGYHARFIETANEWTFEVMDDEGNVLASEGERIQFAPGGWSEEPPEECGPFERTRLIVRPGRVVDG